jgi:hypothetical protein
MFLSPSVTCSYLILTVLKSSLLRTLEGFPSSLPEPFHVVAVINTTFGTSDLMTLLCLTGAVEAMPSSAASRPKNKSSGNNCDNNPATAMRLRLENERLQSEVEQLRKLVGGGISDLEGASAVVDFDDPLRIQALEIELQHAKEALAGE